MDWKLAFVVAALVAQSTVGALHAEENVYTVKAGDNLTAIAARFDTTVAALVEANGLSNPNFIYVGQRLVLRGGASQAANQAPPQATPPPQPTPSRVADSPTATLAKQRWLAYYGNPWSAQMGVLGELTPSELVRELRRVAGLYQQVSDKPVQPAIHLIATVAQASAGADGMYRMRMPSSVVSEYIDLAAANGMPIILDLQFGRSTVQAEFAAVREFLLRPNVHLALDPEFDMWGSDRPGVQLGHMTADEINYAVRALSEIVTANKLPNKVLMLHQFAESMIVGKDAIADDPKVDIVIDMDGFGGQEIKRKHYNIYVSDEPVEYAAIKLFYKHDSDLFSPSQIMGLSPAPDIVIYQ